MRPPGRSKLWVFLLGAIAAAVLLFVIVPELRFQWYVHRFEAAEEESEKIEIAARLFELRPEVGLSFFVQTLPPEPVNDRRHWPEYVRFTPEIVNALISTLGTGTTEVRRAAGVLLLEMLDTTQDREYGWEANVDWGLLIRAFVAAPQADEDWHVRFASALALRYARSPAPEVVSALLGGLDDETSEVRTFSRLALKEVLKLTPEGIEFLLSELSNERAVRILERMALGSFGSEHLRRLYGHRDAVVGRLTPLLRDPDPHVRSQVSEVLQALEEFGQ